MKASEIFVVREVGENGFKTWHMFKCPICGGHDFEAGQHQNCLNPECEFTIGDFEIDRKIKNGEFDGHKIELDQKDENKKGELLELTKEDDDYDNYHILLEEYLLNKYKNKK